MSSRHTNESQHSRPTTGLPVKDGTDRKAKGQGKGDCRERSADINAMDPILLKAAKFRVERRQYDVPGQGRVHRELVVHPGAVVILPLLSPAPAGTPSVNGEYPAVVMIRNYRFAVGQELLELPAGTLEPGEPPIACAARELEEETGYVAEHIEPLCEFYTTPGFTDERMHVFVATGLTKTVQKLDATEQIRVDIIPLADALSATTDGRIIDGKTIAALQVYHYRQARRT